MAIDSHIRDHTDERQVAGDIKRLAAALPPGVRKAQLTIACRDCGKRWERKISMADEKAPEAFAELVKNGRIHAALYEHRNVEMTVEPLL